MGPCVKEDIDKIDNGQTKDDVKDGPISRNCLMFQDLEGFLVKLFFLDSHYAVSFLFNGC